VCGQMYGIILKNGVEYRVRLTVSTYLFLLTIGPVQDFIAAARRTRDLWAGSQLLSDLSRAAAIYLDEQQAELIFPNASTDNEDLQKHDVVNRIVAKIKIEDIKQFGTALEAKINQVFREKYNKVLNSFPEMFLDCTLAKRQLADLLEISWAAVEFDDNYNSAREQLERILAARKNTRDFMQSSWSQAGLLSSSIDGKHQSVIAKECYVQRGDNDAIKKQKFNDLWQKFHISGAEQLSGIDLFKRWYQPDAAKSNDHDFPSTSHIAALPFIWRYVRANLEYQSLEVQDCHNINRETTLLNAINAYVKNLQTIQSKVKEKEKVVHQSSRFTHFMPYDASILFESRLREITDSDQLKDRQSPELKKANKELRDFYQHLNTPDRPSPYYAILLADGDAMGQAIDKLAVKEHGIEQHKQFSQKLDQFASSVRAIVESHWGALIYSGGDDVLALVPLHSLLSCAKELHDEFDNTWEDFAELSTKPTLSMGIAIAHYMEPLSDTLNLARAAEKKAKAFAGVKDQAISAKNALAITLSKRSGSNRTIVGSWATDFYQRLLKLIQLYRYNTIPDGYAFELDDLWQRLGSAVEPAILRAEAKRIAKRKLEGKGSSDLLELVEMLPNKKAEEKTIWNIQMLVNELVIASELARALGSVEATATQEGLV
jgi:CRISPR-associated protein Cmr2